MAKVMIVGYGLPEKAQDKPLLAGNYRTYQFFLPLKEAGHIICLCSADYPETFEEDKVFEMEEEGFLWYKMNFFKFDQSERLQYIHDSFAPDAILGITYLPALRACDLKSQAPLWFDLYGSVMAEVQAKAFTFKTNSVLPVGWVGKKRLLLRADKFSACSWPQKHALSGELMAMGRVNLENFGYEMVEVVQPALMPIMNKSKKTKEPFLRGKHIKKDDFALLWVGGYNTWTDIETLFKGLELAMEANPKIKFVSLGGPIKDHDEVTYEQFLSLIEGSKHKGSYIMLGWRPYGELAHYYAEADLGINIDRLHYETIYGTRTRLVEMLSHGLPVMTSLGCELSHLLKEAGTDFTFPCGDYEALAEMLIKASKKPSRVRADLKKVLMALQGRLSFQATTAPVLTWLKEPRRAPDWATLNPLGVDRKGILDHMVEKIRTSPAYKVYASLLKHWPMQD